MSSLRSHDDTWDIATSVGSTAVMVAAARAGHQDSRVRITDERVFAFRLPGAGTGVWETLLDQDVAAKIAEVDDEAAKIFEHMGSYQAVRTHFFDAYFTEAVAAGIRQIVILAAGLDSRAYRLEWPAGTTVFEIDQPKVLEYKAETLAAHGAQPSARRHEVAVDLRQDWPKALREAGFDDSQPTAWLAEGLLMYLPADAQERLFELVTELSAPGSRIAAETAGVSAGERREEMRERFERFAAQFNMEQALNIQDLIYEDPDRADVAEWLGANGWRAGGVHSLDEMRRLGRYVEIEHDDTRAFSTFVTAEKL